MLSSFKTRKSAGIKVSEPVYHLIRSGNQARDRQEWPAAAKAYAAALKLAPGLRHIRIQLAHMLKEAGQLAQAAECYQHVLADEPENAELIVNLAHLDRRRGRDREAVLGLIQATLAGDETSVGELQRYLSPILAVDAATVHRALRLQSAGVAIPPDPRHVAEALERVIALSDEDGGRDEVLKCASAILHRLDATRDMPIATANPDRLIFDISDLIAHFRHHRLPTGIQRVQIEVIARALRTPEIDVGICCFISGRDHLLDVPAEMFLRLVMASTSGSRADAEQWPSLVAALFIHFLTTAPFAFRDRDTLINLGTSWWIYNYFLIVRNAKVQNGIRFAAFVHDLIPIMSPEHCVGGVIEDYVSWLIGAFDHTDMFLVNSQSTARDLERAATRLGRTLEANRIEVVPLDADFRKPALPRDDQLDRLRLTNKDFCLIVSTIESRKNHVLALEAWSRLIARHGIRNVPMLVCVGRNGWLNAPFFDRLRRDAKLADHVLVIERVSDDELAALYRSCLFTIYPSHYEGWGLPVTEALCFGKVPVVADNSSLPEAGGAFALYFESDYAPALQAAVERLLFEPGLRGMMESAIRAGFSPRSWSEIAGQIIAASRNAVEATGKIAPTAVFGKYYPVTLHKGTRIWPKLGSGEIFRIGAGWNWPEPGMARTRQGGGTLRLSVAANSGTLRVYLLLCGLETRRSRFLVRDRTGAIAGGSLEAGEIRWIMVYAQAPAVGHEFLINIVGSEQESLVKMQGGVVRTIESSIGIAGFAICRAEIERERLAFVEQATLGLLEDAAIYTEQRTSQLERVV